jgi:hypothetical protein
MSAPKPPVRRRRFLVLRIALFLLSLPFVYWAVVQYGQRAWSYAQSYASLSGFWFWLWTLLFLWATWAIWRALQRKWERAKTLAAEVDAHRSPD